MGYMLPNGPLASENSIQPECVITKNILISAVSQSSSPAQILYLPQLL